MTYYIFFVIYLPEIALISMLLGFVHVETSFELKCRDPYLAFSFTEFVDNSIMDKLFIVCYWVLLQGRIAALTITPRGLTWCADNDSIFLSLGVF